MIHTICRLNVVPYLISSVSNDIHFIFGTKHMYDVSYSWTYFKKKTHYRYLYLRSMSFSQILKSAFNSQIYVLFKCSNWHKNCLEASTAQPSEFSTFNTVQCTIRFCFQICFFKRDAAELFWRRNACQSHWMYAWNFDVLHSFEITCNANDVQTWPTSIMWQGKSAYKSLLWKWRRIDSYESVIDLKIGKGGPWFDIMTSVDADLMSGRRFERGRWSESLICIGHIQNSI